MALDTGAPLFKIFGRADNGKSKCSPRSSSIIIIIIKHNYVNSIEFVYKITKSTRIGLVEYNTIAEVKILSHLLNHIKSMNIQHCIYFILQKLSADKSYLEYQLNAVS